MRDTFASIKSLKEPGQLNRLKDAAVQQLPYRPQYPGWSRAGHNP